MQIYQSKGRECFYYVFRNWIKIVIGAIVIALAFGAWTWISTQKTWEQKKADVETINQQREEAVPVYEQALANYEEDITNKQNELDDYMQELNTALFLRYDEATVGEATAELFFATYDEEGNVKEMPAGLIEAFSVALTENIDWDQVAESGSADRAFLENLFIVSINSDTNIMTLKIFAENELSASIMIDAILIQADSIRADLSGQIGEINYSVISRTSGEGRSDEFLAIKNNVQNHYNEIAIGLQGLYDERDALEAPPEEMSMPTRNQVIKSVIKHSVLGGAVGVVVMIALLYVLFYINGKLHSADELSYYTGTTAMAYEGTEKKKKSIIYRIIAKKENRNLLYSQKEALLRTVSNIKKQYPDVNKVMFTGIRTGAEAANIKKALADTKGHGLLFGIEKNILTDKEAFDHLSYYDAVVLVERVDKTSVELINKEVVQIKIAGKEIVGSLLVR